MTIDKKIEEVTRTRVDSLIAGVSAAAMLNDEKMAKGVVYAFVKGNMLLFQNQLAKANKDLLKQILKEMKNCKTLTQCKDAVIRILK